MSTNNDIFTEKYTITRFNKLTYTQFDPNIISNTHRTLSKCEILKRERFVFIFASTSFGNRARTTLALQRRLRSKWQMSVNEWVHVLRFVYLGAVSLAQLKTQVQGITDGWRETTSQAWTPTTIHVFISFYWRAIVRGCLETLVSRYKSRMTSIGNLVYLL